MHNKSLRSDLSGHSSHTHQAGAVLCVVKTEDIDHPLANA